MPTLPGWDVQRNADKTTGWTHMKLAPADLLDPGQCTITREEYYRMREPDKKVVLVHRDRER